MKTAKIALLGVVVLVVFVALTLSWQTDTSDLNNDTQQGNSTTRLRTGSNAIYVADQRPNSKLTVQLVAIENSGFVAVHEDKNGAPGPIIGVSALLPSGESSNVSIELNRPTKDGETLYAMLHSDNGDAVFDSAIDTPVTENGTPMFMVFSVDNAAHPSGDAVF